MQRYKKTGCSCRTDILEFKAPASPVPSSAFFARLSVKHCMYPFVGPGFLCLTGQKMMIVADSIPHNDSQDVDGRRGADDLTYQTKPEALAVPYPQQPTQPPDAVLAIADQVPSEVTANPQGQVSEDVRESSAQPTARTKHDPSLSQSALAGTPMRTVLVFGETGVGKSSLINMIAGHEIAATSSEAWGCTFERTEHVLDVDGEQFRIWDTAGLDEGERGSAPSKVARRNLQELIGCLGDGLHLVIYCFRGTRFREILKINYNIFYELLCQKSVPIVAVVTGLEFEESMDSWWKDNERDLQNRGLWFDGHACVTTTKGKQLKSGEYMLEQEYVESQQAVRDLIKSKSSLAPLLLDDGRLEGVVTGFSRYHGRGRSDGAERMQVPLAAPRQSRMGVMLIDAILAVLRYLGYADESVESRDKRLLTVD
jgi:small GTP-binding protein